MESWQRGIIFIYALIALFAFFKGIYESKTRKNAYGLIRILLPWGIIAWGDAVVFGPFWVLVSLVTLFLNDWYLFLLSISIFWVVRSLGETMYWFNQQFAKTREGNEPEKLPWHSIFDNDSVWLIHQIIWQCVTVVAIVASIYVAYLWLQ